MARSKTIEIGDKFGFETRNCSLSSEGIDIMTFSVRYELDCELKDLVNYARKELTTNLQDKLRTAYKAAKGNRQVCIDLLDSLGDKDSEGYWNLKFSTATASSRMPQISKAEIEKQADIVAKESMINQYAALIENIGALGDQETIAKLEAAIESLENEIAILKGK